VEYGHRARISSAQDLDQNVSRRLSHGRPFGNGNCSASDAPGGDTIARSPEVAVQTRQLCLLIGALGGAASCGGPQSALVAAGTDAARIADLFHVMTAGALIVWAAVLAIAVYTIRVRESHSQRAASLLIVGGGVVAPTLVLGALIVYGMPLVPAVLAIPPGGTMTIEVTAKQWWWRVQYRTPAGVIETANELRLPVGARVELELRSIDVIHSFWVPSLAGKMDMIPGRVTRLALEPTQTGTFRGVCAEYCGASHALMAFSVVVMEADAFRAWLDAQARPAAAAGDPRAARGETAFITHGCTACHTVRGTSGVGRIGPDLTHVGSRRRLAAETLPNDLGSLDQWIEHAGRFKPGVRMPAFRTLAADERSAIAAYLSGLQ
jgi:cytochrome c oxidase subunit 2